LYIFNFDYPIVLNKTFQLESFGITDIGLVREHNEDVWAAYPDEKLFILADGMGGHYGGEIASKEAIEQLFILFKKEHLSERTSLEEVKAFFKKAFFKVNTWIYEKGEGSEELKGMGTTLCSLFFHRHAAILAHVGDSRIYRLRSGKLQQLTEDHSLVAELVSLGAMKPEQAEDFPYKHILTKAIGTHPKVEPTITSVEVEPHDVFMLCSDGMTNYANHGQMEEILKTDETLTSKGTGLVALALREGGGDNITLILVDTLP
jgi:PPM family protein phosphatase